MCFMWDVQRLFLVRVHGTLSYGMRWVEVASPSGAGAESCVHACVFKYERNKSYLSPWKRKWNGVTQSGVRTFLECWLQGGSCWIVAFYVMAPSSPIDGHQRFKEIFCRPRQRRNLHCYKCGACPQGEGSGFLGPVACTDLHGHSVS